uniref:ZU5 domain-containing protein n=1 Tax=Macrostomum lignano TaxID=282301 RepID=A0A1I8J630_9PLAT
MKPRIIATTQAPELQQQEQQEQKNSSEATSASLAMVDFPRQMVANGQRKRRIAAAEEHHQGLTVELANMRQGQRYRLALTLPVLRRPLPSQPPTQHLRLVGRPSDQPATSDSDDSESWTTMEVTEETFQVSPNGALLNLKLDPIVSVRIPKRGCSEALDCCFSIIPFSDERLTLARRKHPSQTMDIRSLSPVYNFNYPGGEFKRPITLKLPLPQWLLSSGDSAGAPASAADSASVTIFYQPRPGLAEPWRILDPGSSLKLTKNSISFEARHLTRYCFASVSPTKVQRASLAMPLLCSWNTAMEGEILLFAKLEDRRWRLCVDCAPRNEIVERISDRVQVTSLKA